MSKNPFPKESVLYDIYNLHLFSKTIVFSAIREEKFNRENTKYQDRHEPYEPSMFIYSFFVYNTLYNINWVEAKKQSYSNLPSLHGYQDSLRQQFILLISGHSKSTAWFLQSFRKGLNKYIKRKSIDLNNKTMIDWSLYMLENIKDTPDYKSGISVKNEHAEFIKSFRKVFYDKHSISSDDFVAFDNLIYKVRCNLFHGAKNFSFFDAYGQNERLALYSIILSSMCDVHFKVLLENLGISTE